MNPTSRDAAAGEHQADPDQPRHRTAIGEITDRRLKHRR
jgi:hypothetical protein